MRRRATAGQRVGIVGIVGILGELFITASILVLLFLVWQLWFNDIVVGGEQQTVALQLSEGWDRPVPTASEPPERGEPVVAVAPENAVSFATLYVPRFGADYVRPIAEGIGVRDVLNKIGFGHYPETQMPGEVGNFAIAAHRKVYGGGLEYVQPTGVGVFDPVLQTPGATPTDRISTLTSCNPFFSTAERIIAYGVYDSWYPRSGGPPAEIAPLVQAGGI